MSDFTIAFADTPDPDKTFFLGVQVDVPGSSPHYGWLQFSLGPVAGTLTLLDYAVESEANTAISTPVPEPTTLSLLAMGFAGLAALRRRASR